MKLLPRKESYDRLMSRYADCCDLLRAQPCPANIFMSIENNQEHRNNEARHIHGLKQFDFAIIPQHDNPAKRKMW